MTSNVPDVGFETLVEHSSDVITVLDEAGTIRYQSPSVERVLGYGQAALVGEDTFEYVHPSDRSAARTAFEKLVREGDLSDTVEFRYRRADGSWVWLEASGSAVSGRTAGGYVVNSREITRRRRQQERLRERERTLRAIYEASSDPDRSFGDRVTSLLELGRDVIDTDHATLSRIDGDDYCFQVVQSPDDDLRSGDVMPLAGTFCERAAATERTVVFADVARDAPELTDRASYEALGIGCYLGAPVFVDGEVCGTLCFYDEVSRTDPFSEWEVALVDLMSQWVSHELTRRRARERLERQNEQLERFVSIVSHDLRNPLTVIDGSLRLVEETSDPRHLDRCRGAVDRMRRLVEEVLTLARAGKRVSEPEPVALSSVAEACWGAVATGTATLTVETEGTVLADRSRLRQLFENLFRNAVEHGSTSSRTEPAGSPEHGSTGSRTESDDSPERDRTNGPSASEGGPDREAGTVTVTVSELSDGDGFYVEDDGPGIPEGERERVFEDGYSTVEGGTGFGLNIVREIARAHGWEVRVTESAAGGARFEITGVDCAR